MHEKFTQEEMLKKINEDTSKLAGEEKIDHIQLQVGDKIDVTFKSTEFEGVQTRVGYVCIIDRDKKRLALVPRKDSHFTEGTIIKFDDITLICKTD